MNRFVACLFMCVASFAHADSNFKFSNSQGPYSVGLHVIQQYDYSRSFAGKYNLVTAQPNTGESARPMQTLVWYPAQKGGTPVTYSQYIQTSFTEENFDRTPGDIKIDSDVWFEEHKIGLSEEQMKIETSRKMWASTDATPVKGKFPLVIYAPSLSAPAFENADLCEYLASQGYVVIATPSMGQNSHDMSTDDAGIEVQVDDIEYLIGYAKSLQQVDLAHIAVMGYSWGGISNFYAAAKDSRISALVALDGAVRYWPKLAKNIPVGKVSIPLLYISQKPSSIEKLNSDGFTTDFSLLNLMKYSEVDIVTMYPLSHGFFSSKSIRFTDRKYFNDYAPEEVSLAYSWFSRYVGHFLNIYLKGKSDDLTFMTNTAELNGAPAHTISVELRHPNGDPPSFDSLVANIEQRGFEHAKEIYQELQKKDENFKLSVGFLDTWGYKLVALKMYKEAISIFELEAYVYPPNSGVYDALGEVYQRLNENETAIKYFKRSNELYPNGFAKRHLKELGVEVN